MYRCTPDVIAKAYNKHLTYSALYFAYKIGMQFYSINRNHKISVECFLIKIYLYTALRFADRDYVN